VPYFVQAATAKYLKLDFINNRIYYSQFWRLVSPGSRHIWHLVRAYSPGMVLFVCLHGGKAKGLTSSLKGGFFVVTLVPFTKVETWGFNHQPKASPPDMTTLQIMFQHRNWRGRGSYSDHNRLKK
jgi:hypothetical protein